jgi:hypothetical protein
MGRLDVRIQHGHGGDGPGAWAALAVLIALAAAGGAARHVIGEAAHVLVTVLAVIAWTLAGAGIVAVVSGGVLAGVRIKRAVRAARARRGVPPVIAITPDSYARHVPDAYRSAIDAPRGRAGGSWPLPGWWEEIRPRIGGDGDERRRPAAPSRRHRS